jgi:valyl-tRNA synthetase
MFCANTEEEAHINAKKHYKKDVELIRDPDALDTWFSSALWPFAVLDYNMD